MAKDQTPENGKPRRAAARKAGAEPEALDRVVEGVDPETWKTLGAALGQLTAIHDPIPNVD